MLNISAHRIEDSLRVHSAVKSTVSVPSCYWFLQEFMHYKFDADTTCTAFTVSTSTPFPVAGQIIQKLEHSGHYMWLEHLRLSPQLEQSTDAFSDAFNF